MTEESKPELVILERTRGSITVHATREFFGYGHTILLTEEAQKETLLWFVKHREELCMEVYRKGGFGNAHHRKSMY